MGKLMLYLEVFKKGSAVADPALWKQRSGLAIAIAGLLTAVVAVAKAYGYEIPGFDSDVAMALGTFVVFVVGLFSNYATSDKVGLPGPGTTADARPSVDVPPTNRGTDDPKDNLHGGGP